jgi:hypothetical protein
MVGSKDRGRMLERIREICLGLPETSERLTKGARASCWERPAGVRRVGLGRPEARPLLGVRLAPRGLVEAARRERA